MENKQTNSNNIAQETNTLIKELNKDIKSMKENSCEKSGSKENAFVKSTNLQTVFEYASDLSKYSFIKRAIFSMMAGIFVGMSYLVYVIIKASFYTTVNGVAIAPSREWIGVSNFIGAAMFPFAIFAILYLGGNLFTSNSLMYLAAFKKIMKPWKFIYQLLITWIFNFIGSLLMVGISYVILWNNLAAHEVALGIGKAKLQDEWYITFVSGIVCNILVAGSVYGYKVIPSKTSGFLFVYLSITFFALSGFQHTVANMFIVPMGLSYSGDASLWGKFFYNNLLPITISNTLGGLIVPTLYILAESKIVFHNKHSH